MSNKPKAHRLLGNKDIKIPQYFMFVDTETLLEEKDNGQTIHHFRLGVAIYLRLRKDNYSPNREVFNFVAIQAFWDYALSKIQGKNTLNIIAHNALFDMTVLDWINELTKRGFECTFIFEQGHTFISKWKKDEKRIMILDNANWFDGKLEKWGDTLGTKKLEMPDFNDTNEKWFTYCERDVVILEELQKWLIEFLVTNNLGNWKLTRASLAFSSYRHRFMKHPIYIPEQTRETYLARQAYKGGRTEVFRVGEYTNDTFYKLDINSMYPSVMINNYYPTCVDGYSNKPSISRIENILENNLVIGRFRIRPTLPYFPIRLDKTLVYPIGEFDTYLSTPEIILCIRNDWLVKCYELAWYRKRVIFTEFVEYFYNQRLLAKENGNELMSTTFKLILNSLYGKFGQRRYKDKVIGKAIPNTIKTSFLYDAVTGERGMIRQLGTNVIKSVKSGEAYNAFCAIATHVTAYARIMLYDYVLEAGRENVYYTDTDSLIVNSDGYNNLHHFINDAQLGKLKIEGISNYVDIRCPKDYTFGKEIKIKGVGKGKKEVKPNTYRVEIWPGLNRILEHNSSQYYNYFVDKTLRRRVKTGKVQNDGEVTPFSIRG